MQSVRGFLRNRQLKVNLDRLAKRYHKLPSELLGVTLQDWTFNLACAIAGAKQDEREMERAKSRRGK